MATALSKQKQTTTMKKGKLPQMVISIVKWSPVVQTHLICIHEKSHCWIYITFHATLKHCPLYIKKKWKMCFIISCKISSFHGWRTEHKTSHREQPSLL